jgi:hypothetical protein
VDVMDGEEERLMQAEKKLAEVIAERDAAERVLAVVLEVISDAQFGEIRARLDAGDQARL